MSTYIDILEDIKHIVTNKNFIGEFNSIKVKNKYKLANVQENLICKYCSNFTILENQRDTSKHNLKFGDMLYKDEYFIDLKISTIKNRYLVGAIGENSISNFVPIGFYLCLDYNLSKALCIPATVVQYYIDNNYLTYEKIKDKKFIRGIDLWNTFSKEYGVIFD